MDDDEQFKIIRLVVEVTVNREVTGDEAVDMVTSALEDAGIMALIFEEN
jgi:hypothetical protein